jgi:hypothetical protein
MEVFGISYQPSAQGSPDAQVAPEPPEVAPLDEVVVAAPTEVPVEPVVVAAEPLVLAVAVVELLAELCPEEL